MSSSGQMLTFFSLSMIGSLISVLLGLTRATLPRYNFYPPFCAGPDSSEQPPLSFRPALGSGGHTVIPMHPHMVNWQLCPIRMPSLFLCATRLPSHRPFVFLSTMRRHDTAAHP